MRPTGLLLTAAALSAFATAASAQGLLGARDVTPTPSPDSLQSDAAPPAPGSPLALVRPFYERFGLERDPAQRGSFVDPARAVLDAADRLEASGEGECLDPYMALDNAAPDAAQIAASLRMTAAEKGDAARVIVAFVEDGAPHRLQWTLRRVNGAWKIADLLSVTGEWALSQYQCE